MHGLCMTLRLSSGSVAANVLRASSGVNSLCLLRNQPCSDECIHGITLVRVDLTCPDGFQPRLVQKAHKDFMVDS